MSESDQEPGDSVAYLRLDAHKSALMRIMSGSNLPALVEMSLDDHGMGTQVVMEITRCGPQTSDGALMKGTVTAAKSKLALAGVKQLETATTKKKLRAICVTSSTLLTWMGRGIAVALPVRGWSGMSLRR